LNEGWVDKEKDRVPSYDEIIQEDEKDLDDIDNQDEFEAKYNFRFEEPFVYYYYSFKNSW